MLAIPLLTELYKMSECFWLDSEGGNFSWGTLTALRNVQIYDLLYSTSVKMPFYWSRLKLSGY